MIAAVHTLPPMAELDKLVKKARDVVADPMVAPPQFVAAAGVLFAWEIAMYASDDDPHAALAIATLAIAAKALRDEEGAA